MNTYEDESKTGDAGVNVSPDIDADNLANSDECMKAGTLLAEALRQVPPGDCLSLEELAVLAGGTTSKAAKAQYMDAEARERMMMHLASCDDCYDTFLLISQLEKKELKLLEKPKAFLANPLRLAASIMIAAFSLFLFYKIAMMPGALKQADEMPPGTAISTMEIAKAAEEAPAEYDDASLGAAGANEEIPPQPPVLAKKATSTDSPGMAQTTSERKEEKAADSMKLRSKTTGREAGKDTGSTPEADTASKESRSVPAKGMGYTSGNIDQKKGAAPAEAPDADVADKSQPGEKRLLAKTAIASKAGPTATTGAGEESRSRLEETEQQLEQYDQYVQQEKQKEIKKQAHAATRKPPQDLQSQQQVAGQMQVKQQTQDARQQVIQEQEQEEQLQQEPPSKKADITGKGRVQEEGEAREQIVQVGGGAPVDAGTWILVDQLNSKLSLCPTYIPDEQVDSYLRTALLLCKRLEDFFTALKLDTNLANKPGQIEKYLARGKPAIVVIIDRDALPIQAYPDMKYFLEKIRPGTPAWQFFNLTLSGWCDGSRCYGKIEQKGKTPQLQEQKNALLKSWQELRPQLSGVLKEISTYTIAHLVNNKN